MKITKLRAIRVELNIKRKIRNIRIRDILVVKETDKQYKIQPIKEGEYRSIVSKPDLNTILSLYIDENDISYVVFIPWNGNSAVLEETTKEIIESTFNDIKAGIDKKVSNYQKLSRCLEKGLEKFNFVQEGHGVE